jgi:hypothetical protein
VAHGGDKREPLSCFYRLLGGALYAARWQLWARRIQGAAQGGPAEGVSGLILDASTTKTAGRQIEGGSPYRNGAGSARHDYRPLRGLTCVWGQRRVPGPGGPGRRGRVPSGWSLYVKEEPARKLQLPSQTRSALAREIVAFGAAQLPTRRIRVLGEGG